MKKHLLFALAATLLPLAAFAEPSARPDVEELLVLTRTEAMLESSMKASKAMVEQVLLKQFPSQSPEAARQLKEVQAKTTALMLEEMGWQKMKGDFVQLYASTFSPEEIKGLIAFYKSPLGQQLLDKTPALMQGSMQIAQNRMMAVMPKLQAVVQEALQKPAPAAQPGEK